MTAVHVLQNRYLVARISPEDGQLLHLAAGDGAPNLMAGTHCRYVDEADRWYGGQESPEDVVTTAVGFITKVTRSSPAVRYVAIIVIIGEVESITKGP